MHIPILTLGHLVPTLCPPQTPSLAGHGRFRATGDIQGLLYIFFFPLTKGRKSKK